MPNITPSQYRKIVARQLSRDDAPVVSYPESVLHEAILSECRARGWFVIHSRMDKPTTTGIGCPDFVIFAERRVLIIESKAAAGKLSLAQKAMIAQLTKLGHSVMVIRSLREWEKLTSP